MSDIDSPGELGGNCKSASGLCRELRLWKRVDFRLPFYNVTKDFNMIKGCTMLFCTKLNIYYFMYLFIQLFIYLWRYTMVIISYQDGYDYIIRFIAPTIGPN